MKIEYQPAQQKQHIILPIVAVIVTLVSVMLTLNANFSVAPSRSGQYRFDKVQTEKIILPQPKLQEREKSHKSYAVQSEAREAALQREAAHLQKVREALRLLGQVERKTYEEAKALSRKDTPVILWYWQTSCGHCTVQAPLLAEFATKYKGKVVAVRSFDWDGADGVEGIPVPDAEYGDGARQLGDTVLTMIPTFVVFRNGQQAFTRKGRYTSTDTEFNAITKLEPDDGAAMRRGFERLFTEALSREK